MGKGDRRHSNKSLQRKGQRKKKERIKRLSVERQARFAVLEKGTEKKRPARRTGSSTSAS